MLNCDISQRKIHSFVLKGSQELFENHPKKFWFPKSCPHKKLAEQIFHIQPPNSCMLCVGMFQGQILSFLRLLKGYCKLFENCPKKFWFPKSCPQSTLPEQLLHIQPQNSSMLCFSMFQQKIHSILLNGYHMVLPSRPKKLSYAYQPLSGS